MSGAQTPPDLVYAGSFCHCVRQPLVPGQTHQAYALVSHVDQQIIGKLTWHEGTRRYVLETKPKSLWNSTALSEVALWMRKLSRVGMDVTMRTTGHLLVAVAVTWWLLVSHMSTQQCVNGTCTTLPKTATSRRELGRFGTQERCEAIRAALEPVWTALESEVGQDLQPDPKEDEQIHMVTTFQCVQEPASPEEKP
jgi:hypothetical protein